MLHYTGHYLDCKERIKFMKQPYLKHILALLLFGSNGVVASRIAMNSYEIVLFRTLCGSILLIAIFLLAKGKLSAFKDKKQFLFLSISGVAMGASWMFLYEAYQQVGVSIATLLYYCGPVIVMVLSPLLFRERLTAPKIIGFLVVLCGIFLINGQTFGEGKTLWGLLCGILSAVTYALMVIFNKKADRITGLENSMLQLVISFLTVAAFVGFKQGFVIEISAGDWIPILILGFINTGIGCYFYFSSIGRLPVQTVAILGYLEPLSAIFFSVLFLREVLLPAQIAGGILILGGAIFGERVKSQPRVRR